MLPSPPEPQCKGHQQCEAESAGNDSGRPAYSHRENPTRRGAFCFSKADDSGGDGGDREESERDVSHYHRLTRAKGCVQRLFGLADKALCLSNLVRTTLAIAGP